MAKIFPKVSSNESTNTQLRLHQRNIDQFTRPRPTNLPKIKLEQESDQKKQKNKQKQNPQLPFKSIIVLSQKILPQTDSHKKIIDLPLTHNSDESSFNQIKADNQVCDICVLQLPEHCFEVFACQHSFCKDCVEKLMYENLNNFRFFRCPYENCKRNLDVRKFSFFCQLPEPTQKKCQKFALFMSLIHKKNQKLCPNEFCDQGIIKIEEDEDKQTGTTQCSKCKEIFCIRCLLPAHPIYLACKSWKDEQQLALEGGKNLCRCTKCDNIIEKNEGCRHMTCKCSYEFCFRCGERWRIFHICNPFYSQHYRWSSSEESQLPKIRDYIYYVFLVFIKIIWTLFIIGYAMPFFILGLIITMASLTIGITLFGVTFGFISTLKEYFQRTCWLFLLTLIFFPFGMLQGAIKMWKIHHYKIIQTCITFLKHLDLVLPFNLIPFECLM